MTESLKLRLRQLVTDWAADELSPDDREAIWYCLHSGCDGLGEKVDAFLSDVRDEVVAQSSRPFMGDPR